MLGLTRSLGWGHLQRLPLDLSVTVAKAVMSLATKSVCSLSVLDLGCAHGVHVQTLAESPLLSGLPRAPHSTEEPGGCSGPRGPAATVASGPQMFAVSPPHHTQLGVPGRSLGTRLLFRWVLGLKPQVWEPREG